MIPEEKTAAVTRALRETFGVNSFDDIRMMTRGNATTRVFRIVVRGTPYLLKITMRTDDATRHFACMRAAAEAGLAPRVWYTSVEDRLSITDFLDAVPLPATDALVCAPATLRALHALAPFPGAPHRINTTCTFLLDQGAALEEFFQRFRAAGLLPEDETADLLDRHAQLVAAYPLHEPDMVSSHNDLFKPDNILYDGGRIWLVDWEAAFLNDRYADLAVLANMLVTNDSEERAFLDAYFGEPAGRYQRARFFLMQQVAHLFYALGFLFLGSLGGQPDLAAALPGWHDFQHRYWTGEITTSDKPSKILYGRIHRERLIHNMRQPRFQESVKIVSERYALP